MTLRRGAPHAKGQWLTLGLALAAGLLIIAQAVFALGSSTFEGADGNLLRDDSGNTDWCNEALTFNGTCPDGSLAPNLTVREDQPTGSTDDAFGQGAKEDISNPTVVDGSIPPNKSDLTRFYTAHEKVGSDTFLYLAWERSNVLGSANMDFEFNQSSTIDTNLTTPVRTNGDMLITFDFTNGGTKPVLGSLRWLVAGEQNPNGSGPNDKSSCYASSKLPCWGDYLNLTNASLAEGQVNFGGDVVDPIAPDAPRTIPAYEFGEAAINVSDLLGSSTSGCTSFGSAFLKSRSSASFTAELKDFIAPQPISISNCGIIKITKVSQNANGTFAYSSTGGLPSPAANDGSFSIATSGYVEGASDGTATTTFNSVLAGNYTITEGAQSAPWDFVSLSCTQSGGSSVDFSSDDPTATITMAADGEVDCTYTNHFTASPAVSTSATSSITIGSTIKDTATLSGLVNPDGTGTITFELYGPDDATCSGTNLVDGDSTFTVDAGSNGSYDSPTFTPTAVGTYRWIANFSGDANNNPTSNGCNLTGEASVVGPVTPGASTTPNVQIRDNVTMTGGYGTITGTVDFMLYSDATCSTLIGSDLNVTLSGEQATSKWFDVTSSWTNYYWKIHYDGDGAANAPYTSGCGEGSSITLPTP